MQLKTIVSISLFAIAPISSFAGSEGNIGFCVYKAVQSNSEADYQVRSTSNSCVYAKGDNSGKRKTEIPLSQGHLLATIHVGKESGTYCTSKTWHYEIDSTFGCMTHQSFYGFNISDKHAHKSLSFGYGNDDGTHNMSVFKNNNHESKYPLNVLQLSDYKSPSQGNRVECESGWCVNGSNPGSDVWVIWSPTSELPYYSATAAPRVNTVPGGSNYSFMGPEQQQQDCASSQPDKGCKAPHSNTVLSQPY